MTAAGFVLTALATLGSYGALLRSKRLIWWFTVFSFIILLAEFVFGLVTATWMADKDVTYVAKVQAGKVPNNQQQLH